MKINETNNVFGAEDEIVLAPMAEKKESTPAAMNAAEQSAESRKSKKHAPLRVEEIRELREKHKRFFRMDDGSLQAVFTPSMEEADTQIDPLLVLEENGKHYRQRRKDYTARFSRDEENDELFSLEKGDYSVTVFAKKKKRSHPHGTLPSLNRSNEKETLVFKGIKDGTDYEYTAKDNGVKENILVKKKANAYTYSFLLSCRGLFAELDEANTRISFHDKNNSEEIFFIPAPFMTDASGERSEALSYSLSHVAEDSYTFSVTASAEWMNAEERAFPVVIDPQILVNAAFFRTYSWQSGTVLSSNMHTVGITGSDSSNEDTSSSNDGSSRANAIPLVLNQIVNGSIAYPGSAIWYKITPKSAGLYTFSADGSLDTVGTLYDASECPIASNDDSGKSLNFSISAGLSADETYYLKVGAYGAKTGHYTLNATADCIAETEAYYSVNRMYMSFSMPTLPRNPRIKKAELQLFQSASSTSAYECTEHPLIGLYQVNSDICTGACTPIDDADLIDYARMNMEEDTKGKIVSYTFDITTLVDKINKNESYLPHLVLKMLDESIVAKNNITLYGSSYGGEYVPKIVITYESSYGVNTSYRTHTHELGRFGQGSVDLQCGNLMFESEDFAWSGNRMPVTIKHLFNSALAGYTYTNNSAIKLATAVFSAMKLGYGFKLNLMQSMVLTTFTHEGKPCVGYVYIGENGEETYFKESTQANSNASQCCNVYEDVNGSGMIYNSADCKLTQGEDTYQFDAFGRLIRITDANENHMDITYASNRITTVTDGAGREFGFAYNTSGQLTHIKAPDLTTINYTYTNNLLTGIAYPDGKKAVIAYSSNKPTSVTLKDVSDKQVYKVVYSFSGNRLYSVTEYGSDNSIGAKSTYSYSVASARTLVTTTEQKDTDEGETANNVITTTYTFDDDGNIVSEYVYSTDTGRVGGDGEESGINPHSGDGGAGVVSNINNLLQNHSFETLANWHEMSTCCGTHYIFTHTDESTAKFGKKVLCIETFADNSGDGGAYQTVESLPAGQYTFSAYLRVRAWYSSKGVSAFIRVCDSCGNILGVSERLSQRDSEYTRLIVPFEIDSQQSVQVQILTNGAGAVYADAAQLENNPYANAYNMLENGNFERGISSWEPSGSVSSVTGTCFNMKKSLCMYGSVSSDTHAWQMPAVRTTRSTRETFTLSGWAKGWGLPNHEREDVKNAPRFRLRAVIHYKDTYYNEFGTEEFTADFSPATEEWQFASVQFSKSKYRTVDGIRVYCDYGYNSGVAYFDDIQLVRNSVETGLSAEDFITDEPVENDESTAADTESTTESTQAFGEAKDDFGNALTETTFTDGELGTLYRAFGFNANGNDLLFETDARGHKTAYTVNEKSSRNEEVTDRLGNKTAYEYDDSGRTTKVTSKNADGAEIAHVSYAYDTFDNMTEIVRGDGMKYALAYNEFHNLASIGIEGKDEALIKYIYKNGNGRLKQMTYANGHTMKAIYNSIGQMVAEKWFETEADAEDSTKSPIAHYKYTYDGEGNIVRSIDITAKKEYNYEYEEGKIIRATEADITLADELVTAKTVVHSIKHYYDSEGNLTKKVITPKGGEAQTVYYETTDDKTVVKFTAGGQTVTSHSKTDSFGRKVFDELQLGSGFLSREFDYHKGEVTDEHAENGKLKSSPTTQLVSRILLSDGRTLSYEYDAEERITKVVDSVNGTTEYTYDALGQLLTERHNGYMVNSMTYDTYGNILSKNGKAYTYGDAKWKDLLTAVDGEAIEYDAQGNPIKYLGHTLTWEKGRQLKSFDGNTYTYNANGIRTSKTINGVKHEYTLDGTKILRETWGSNTLIPLYDNEDGVCGIIYNNIPYYFIKNLQGDIIAIANKNGKTVAEYSYDAWGVPTILSDNTGVIANVNPFRYRSYYFDVEIGLYYLQSRYYDANTGRFVNTDSADVISQSSNIFDCNIYIYCHNNPVNNIDISGAFIAQKIAEVILSAVFGMIFQLFTDFAVFLVAKLINKKSANFNPDPGDYVDSALDWAFDSIRLFPKKKKYIVNFITAMIRAVVSQIVNYISGYGFDLASMFKSVTISALVCAIKALMNKTAYKKIKKLNKGILKGKKLKNEKIKIKAKYKILGQKIEQCINIPNNIYGFVTDVIASL